MAIVTRSGKGSALTHDEMDANLNEIDLKANLASPTFTGTPTAPTASTGDSSTQIATTEFVKNEPIEYAQMPVGSVIQVIQTLKNDCFYTASSSWVDWTGMSVTITPTRSNSKFLVSMTSGTGNDTTNSFAYVKLQRNGVDIALGDARGGETRCWVDASRQTDPAYPFTAKHISGEYLDNPETGSTIIYKLQVIKTQGGAQAFGGSSNTDDPNRSSIPSTLTVKEIAQ